MRVFCEHQDSHPDTYCNICGQGFDLHWEGQSPREKMEALAEVERTMRRHHFFFNCSEAHPKNGFVVQPRRHRAQMDKLPILREASWRAA